MSLTGGYEPAYALFAERVPRTRRLDQHDVTVDVVVRYLAGHGPATERDIASWATMTSVTCGPA
jgi:Winged helix DNA-binding domain